MRFTERNETPLMRATSVFLWPAFSKTSTSCRFSIPHILLSSTPPKSGVQGDFYRLRGFLGVPEFSELGGPKFTEPTPAKLKKQKPKVWNAFVKACESEKWARIAL